MRVSVYRVSGSWHANDVTRVFARMAETSRAKVKEVNQRLFSYSFAAVTVVAI